MSLSADRIFFGIHSLAPYSRLTGEFFGILKVLGDANLSIAASSVKLKGGSNKFDIASEVSGVESSLTSDVKSYPDFMFEKWGGASVSTTSASATGTVGTITNKSGTSAVSATVGIASVGAKSGSEDEIKNAEYLVKVVSPTTVDVYASSDVDFKISEAPTVYESDLLKITASPLTVPDSGATVEVPNYGLELTGGSGTVAMTIGDTAIFHATKAHGGISEITMGQSTIDYPEMGLWMTGQRRADGSEIEIHAFKAKSSAGMAIPLAEGGYSIANLVTDLLYDSAQDAVMVIRAAAGVV